MKILIDIGHPGHVHLFKNFAKQMQQKGHSILFTCRQKEFEIELLNAEGFRYKSFGKHYNTKTGKIFGILKFNLMLLMVAFRFKPDIFLSHGSIYAAQVSWLIRKTHISFEDTFNFEQIKLYKPFTDVILTADYAHPDLGSKNIQYAGYHELAYLHPSVFTPDQSISNELQINPKENYIILRFVSWRATHDQGHKGLSVQNKYEALRRFSQFGTVFISSEAPLPPDLEQYRFSLPPHKMHSALAFASLIFSESATMASEAAVLGVPAIYLDKTGRYYTREEEEKYSLVFNYSDSLRDQEKAISKGTELLGKSNLHQEWQKKRKRLLQEKIDVTSFLIWFIENYPESAKIMKENPYYQYRFK